MAHIERARAQEEYRAATAARMGQAIAANGKDPYAEYTDRLRTASGYTRS